MLLAESMPYFPLMVLVFIGPGLLSLWIATLILTIRFSNDAKWRRILIGGHILFAAPLLWLLSYYL